MKLYRKVLITYTIGTPDIYTHTCYCEDGDVLYAVWRFFRTTLLETTEIKIKKVLDVPIYNTIKMV
jgi:hypothetical protein